jgi:hypothetical protein
MITYKGREIKPYESFYRGDSERFFRGIIGDGVSRSVKCDDSLAVLVEYEEEIQDSSESREMER